MVTLDLPNSRMKDYFDVYILIRDFSEDIDDIDLKKALKRTFSHRGAQIPQADCRVWSEYFFENKTKLIQWNAFIKKARIKERMTLEEVCTTIGSYINPIFDKYLRK